MATIESGICNVGNVGTKQRLDYTALGPAMNIVARLESEAKARDCAILIGSGTADLASVDLNEVGEMTIKGVSEPIMGYVPRDPD